VAGVTRQAASAALVVATVLVLLVLAILLTHRVGQSVDELQDLSESADQVGDSARGLLQALVDAETGQRGYLLTTQPAYLEPYWTARQRVDRTLADLGTLAVRLAWLRADVDALKTYAGQKLAELDQTVTLASGGNREASLAIINGSVGKATMDAARDVIARVMAHAGQERDERMGQAKERERAANLGALAAAVGGILLLGTATLALLLGQARLTRGQARERLQLERWQGTVESLRDGIAVFDAQDRLLLWNQRLAPISGLPPDLLRSGTPLANLVAAGSEWQPPLLSGERPTPGGDSLVGEVRHDGRVLEVWRSALPEGGQMLAVADITRRVQAEAIAQQAQKMETLGQLTGGVAHDFNNLLQVISANLELLADRLDGGEWMRMRVAAAMEGVSRGARLTRHLLAFARRQPLTPEAIDPARLLSGLDEILRRTLGSRIELELVIAGGLWTLQADAQQLESAVLNLAINARDAMEENAQAGAGKLTIEARNADLDDAYAAANAEVTRGQYVVIAVTDTGCGMTAAQAARAIEPFYTTKPEGKGTGLGLSMVYGFAKQSGGHFKLYSEPGYGTTARLYIPRTIGEPDTRAASQARAARAQGEVVLVVEDEPGVRGSVVQTLRGLGYVVHEAADASAAMRMLEHGLRPDLIFTDVMMPGPLGSRQMVTRARAMTPGVAVVFTSGYTENSIVHNGQLDPGVQLVSKPWRIDELAGRLRSALHEAALIRRDLAAEPARLRVLLVEDETLVRMTTAEMLADLGHEVLEAATAEEALDQLDGAVDLVITDIGLPGTDGLTLAATARQRAPALPVIVATGQLPPRDTNGFVWLAKPYDDQTLQAALAEATETQPG